MSNALERMSSLYGVFNALAAESAPYGRDALPDNDRVVDLSLGEVRGYPLTLPRLELSPATFRYSSPQGDSVLRRQYLRTSVDYGDLGIDEQGVVVTSGAKHALWLSFISSVRPGDKVLLPTPCWAPFRIWTRMLHADALNYDIELPVKDLLELIDRARPNVMILNYPHNPTGIELTQIELDAIIDINEDLQITTIADEVYRSLSCNRPSVLKHIGHRRSRIFVADSISKWTAAAGLRIGFLASQADEIQKLVELRGTIDSCPPLVTQLLAVELLSDCWKDFRASISNYARTSIKMLSEVLEDEGFIVTSKGGLYVWGSDISSCGVVPLSKRGVKLRGVQGDSFGAKGYVRLCPCVLTLSEQQRLLRSCDAELRAI